MKVVLTILLLLASVPSGAAQTLTTSLGVASSTPAIVSTPTTFSVAAGRQSPLGVVATRDGYLVAWADVTGAFTSEFWRLRVSRVREDGSVVDTIGIKVTDTTTLSVVMFAEGDGARLYWTSAGAEGGFPVQTLTVSAEGALSQIVTVGTIPIGDPGGTILRGARLGGVTALQFGRWVMLVEGDRSVRLTDLGGWGDPEEIVAASGRFVSTWVASSGILMSQVLSSGGETLGAPGGTGIDIGVTGASVATDGTRVLIVSSNAAQATVRVLDPADGSVRQTGTIAVPYLEPLLLWNGSRYLATWVDFLLPGIVGIDISSSGVPSTAPPRPFVTGVNGRSFAAAGTSTIAIVDERGGCYRYYCEYDTWVSVLPLDASHPAGSSALVSATSSGQYNPSIAAIGSSFFAAWKEGTSVKAAPISREGRAEPLELGQAAGSTPVVTANGSSFLAAWVDPVSETVFSLKGRFFDARGEATPARFDIPVSVDASDLAAGASGGSFLVAWKEGPKILARRIAADGSPLDGSSPLMLGPSDGVPPDIAVDSDGTAFVVVWKDLIQDTLPESNVLRAVRVTLNGDAIPIGTIYETPQRIWSSAMRCGGGHCLVVWSEYLPGSVDAEMRGMVLRAGDLSDESGVFRITPTPEYFEQSPGVAWDGVSFLVTWTELRSDSSATFVHASTVRPGTPVLLTAVPSIVASSTFGSLGHPSVACEIGGGCVALIETPVDDEENGRSVRLFKSFLTETRLHSQRR